MPPGLAVFFQNYKIGVTNLAWLKPQQRAMLTGDFRAFVEALCEMREKGRITGIDQPVKYIDEMIALLAATTNSPSFNQIDKRDFVGGKTKMCEIMERWENQLRTEGYNNGMIDGKQAGFENGKQVGFENGQNSAVVQIYQEMGRSKADTSDYLVHRYHLTREQANAVINQYWQA